MIRVISQSYEKVLRKLPQQVGGITWKTVLYLSLLVCWVVILMGTFLLLK